MSDSFNPYAEWLGIKTPERPNFYELLGIERGEANGERIAKAATGQTVRLRAIRPGPQLPRWRELMEEIATAGRVLSDSDERRKYDTGPGRYQASMEFQPDRADDADKQPVGRNLLPPGAVPTKDVKESGPPAASTKQAPPTDDDDIKPPEQIFTPPTKARPAATGSPAVAAGAKSTVPNAPGVPTSINVAPAFKLPTAPGAFPTSAPPAANVYPSATAQAPAGMNLGPMAGRPPGPLGMPPAPMGAPPGFPPGGSPFPSAPAPYLAPPSGYGGPPLGAPPMAPPGFGMGGQPGFAPQQTMPAPAAPFAPQGWPQQPVQPPAGLQPPGYGAPTPQPYGYAAAPPPSQPPQAGGGHFYADLMAGRQNASPLDELGLGGSPAPQPTAPLHPQQYSSATFIGQSPLAPAPIAPGHGPAPMPAGYAQPSHYGHPAATLVPPPMPVAHDPNDLGGPLPIRTRRAKQASSSPIPIVIAAVVVAALLGGGIYALTQGNHRRQTIADAGDPDQPTDSHGGAPADHGPTTHPANTPAIKPPVANNTPTTNPPVNTPQQTNPPPANPQTNPAANPPVNNPPANNPPANTQPPSNPPANNPPPSNPPNNPPPATTDQPKPLEPAKVDEIKKLLVGVKSALGQHKNDEAKKLIADAEKIAGDAPEWLSVVDRFNALEHYVDQFWGAVHDSVNGLNPTDEIEIGTTKVIVVEKSADSLTVRFNGGNHKYNLNQVPPGIAVSLASKWLDQADARNKLAVGAFWFVDPKGNVANAKKLWNEAQGAGVAEVKPLLSLLDGDGMAPPPAN